MTIFPKSTTLGLSALVVQSLFNHQPYLAGVAAAAVADTVLDEQFCQVYYNISENDGEESCESLRSSVRSERRGRAATPTLELGNPETQQAMVFLHGWPDTSAVWANQFAAFCGEAKTHFCVAPSLIDYHPDRPRADESMLSFSSQRDEFIGVIEELGLSDITLVIFDFSCIFGNQLVSLYPELFERVISMDIPNPPGPSPFALVPNGQQMALIKPNLMEYQQINGEAFLADDDETMAANTRGTPCENCRIAPNATGVGGRTGWPYYQWVRNDLNWLEDGFDVPPTEWEFVFAPSFPTGVPILYLYASEHFQEQSYLDWIDGRGDGSEHVLVEDSDHWLQLRQPEAVNAKMAAWISSLAETAGDDGIPGGSQTFGDESSSPDDGSTVNSSAGRVVTNLLISGTVVALMLLVLM